MKGIKFRAWCQQHKYIYDVCNLRFIGDKVSANDNSSCIGKEVLMQYTGLKDKNGTEIYEGDIVSYYGYVGEVIWDKYCWNIKDFYSTCYDYPSLAFSENLICEVVGNIYENPELLQN